MQGQKAGNSRNGHGSKRLLGDDGERELSVPRDRNASFELQIVKKGQRRFDGFDGKIISMFARGMSCARVEGHLEEVYGMSV
ncbi:MAG: transposase [Magnetovibrio sp.]|nr:transposase [Magnetovibrio sp.]